MANIKYTCEGDSVVLPDQSEKSRRAAMKHLGYGSMSQDPGCPLEFCRSVTQPRGLGPVTVQARVMVCPTDEPLTNLAARK